MDLADATVIHVTEYLSELDESLYFSITSNYQMEYLSTLH